MSRLFQDAIREPARLDPLPHGGGGYVAGMRRPGLHVEIKDEGGFWPGRSLAALRRNLDEMNGIVAAATGALKDFNESANGQSRVQSPIFAHKNFERMEAEGALRVGPALKKLRAVVRDA